jgi:glycerol-1-phosphatase
VTGAATARDREHENDRRKSLSHGAEGKQIGRDNPWRAMALSPLLAGYDNVLLDLDGCVWVGENATRNAPEAVAELRAGGKSVGCLWSLGLRASLEEVLTVGGAIQFTLAERGGPEDVYVIGSSAVFRHVGEAGMRIVNGTPREREADIVVLAGHDELDYEELRAATQALLAGAELIATDRDRTFPTSDGTSPATGAFVAALEYATGSTARIVGKPDPQIFQTALDRFGPGRTLMVGDHLVSDLAGAAAAGIDAAIVLTGVTSRADAEAASDPAPVAIAEDLYALLVSS